LAWGESSAGMAGRPSRPVRSGSGSNHCRSSGQVVSNGSRRERPHRTAFHRRLSRRTLLAPLPGASLNDACARKGKSRRRYRQRPSDLAPLPGHISNHVPRSATRFSTAARACPRSIVGSIGRLGSLPILNSYRIIYLSPDVALGQDVIAANMRIGAFLRKK
jgi:hypothetical protein